MIFSPWVGVGKFSLIKNKKWLAIDSLKDSDPYPSTFTLFREF